MCVCVNKKKRTKQTKKEFKSSNRILAKHLPK